MLDELFRLAGPKLLETHNELYGEDGLIELLRWLGNALTIRSEEWDDYCYE